MKPLHFLSLTFIAVMLLTDIAKSEEPKETPPDLSARDAIAKFVKENMIGRTLVYTYEGEIADGKLFSSFARKKTFSDLQLTERGLTLKTHYVIQNKTWDLDQDGQRVKPNAPLVSDRVLSTEMRAVQRRSTGQVTGFQMITGNSSEDSHGNADSVRLKMTTTEEGTPALQVEAQTVLYDDHFDQGGLRRPGVVKTTELYFVKDGKLNARYTSSSYKVDPVTLEMSDDSTARAEESLETEIE